jgi:hypothetical protein
MDPESALDLTILEPNINDRAALRGWIMDSHDRPNLTSPMHVRRQIRFKPYSVANFKPVHRRLGPQLRTFTVALDAARTSPGSLISKRNGRSVDRPARRVVSSLPSWRSERVVILKAGLCSIT